MKNTFPLTKSTYKIHMQCQAINQYRIGQQVSESYVENNRKKEGIAIEEESKKYFNELIDSNHLHIEIQNYRNTILYQPEATIEFKGSDIRSVDSTAIVVNDALRALKLETMNGTLSMDESGPSGVPKISSSGPGQFLIIDANPVLQTKLIFEGSSADDFETTLEVTNPTADNTITIPNETGTMVTTGATGIVTSTMIAAGTLTGGDIADDSIGEAKIADDAVGQDQLKSVVNLQILNSSGGVLKSIYGAGA